MAKRIVNRDPYDQGPKERQQHNKVAIELDVNNRARLRVLDQLELDRLLLEKLIDLDQHSAGEHLYRDISSAGYFPQCKWSMDSNIRGSVQNVSQGRASALVKIGLGRAWLLAKVGRRHTEYLFGVVLGERKVPVQYVPVIQRSLNSYQNFEGWWHGQDQQSYLPDLLAELPGDVKRTRPFLDQK
jgi:hypothetical protein